MYESYELLSQDGHITARIRASYIPNNTYTLSTNSVKKKKAKESCPCSRPWKLIEL